MARLETTSQSHEKHQTNSMINQTSKHRYGLAEKKGKKK